MIKKLLKEKALLQLSGFNGLLTVGNNVPTISELLIQILNQVPEDKRTEKDYEHRYKIQQLIHSLGKNQIEEVPFNYEDFQLIKESAFNYGLTPEAYFFFLEAFQ